MIWFALLITISSMVVIPCAAAQASIRVAVIDGHTGKPIVGARVDVMIVRRYQGSTVNTVADGDKYLVQVQPGDTLVLGNVTKSKMSWNEYDLCASEPDAKPTYSVSEILSKGLRAPNKCDRRITSTPLPGEIVFFVYRLSFWRRYHPFSD